MKIKKKEYQKQINDKFWEGVNVGMKFALNNPDDVKRYVDRTEALRKISENAAKAFEGLANTINKMFGGQNDNYC